MPEAESADLVVVREISSWILPRGQIPGPPTQPGGFIASILSHLHTNSIDKVMGGPSSPSWVLGREAIYSLTRKTGETLS